MTAIPPLALIFDAIRAAIKRGDLGGLGGLPVSGTHGPGASGLTHDRRHERAFFSHVGDAQLCNSGNQGSDLNMELEYVDGARRPCSCEIAAAMRDDGPDIDHDGSDSDLAFCEPGAWPGQDRSPAFQDSVPASGRAVAIAGR
jgi:hypothetical protein